MLDPRDQHEMQMGGGLGSLGGGLGGSNGGLGGSMGGGLGSTGTSGGFGGMGGIGAGMSSPMGATGGFGGMGGLGSLGGAAVGGLGGRGSIGTGTATGGVGSSAVSQGGFGSQGGFNAGSSGPGSQGGMNTGSMGGMNAGGPALNGSSMGGRGPLGPQGQPTGFGGAALPKTDRLPSQAQSLVDYGWSPQQAINMIGAMRPPVSATSLGPLTYGGGFGTPGMGVYGPSYKMSPKEHDRMARAMVAESSPIRNLDGTVNLPAMQGIGDVVKNRIDSPKFPDTVNRVINQPKQFSVVKSGALNRVDPTSQDYRSARGLAGAIMTGELPSAVGSSLNFGNQNIIQNQPGYSSMATRAAFQGMPADYHFQDAKNPNMSHTFGTIGGPPSGPGQVGGKSDFGDFSGVGGSASLPDLGGGPRRDTLGTMGSAGSGVGAPAVGSSTGTATIGTTAPAMSPQWNKFQQPPKGTKWQDRMPEYEQIPSTSPPAPDPQNVPMANAWQNLGNSIVNNIPGPVKDAAKNLAANVQTGMANPNSVRVAAALLGRGGPAMGARGMNNDRGDASTPWPINRMEYLKRLGRKWELLQPLPKPHIV